MELREVLIKRRSIRHYDETRQITKEQLKYILAAGMAAPISRKAYDSIHLTVVQSQELLEEISNAFKEAKKPLYGAPTVILVSSKVAAVPNIEYFNVAGVVENMLLAATDLTLGSIYLTAFLQGLIHQRDLLHKLNIPEGYTPLSAIGVGFLGENETFNEAVQVENRIEITYF